MFRPRLPGMNILGHNDWNQIPSFFPRMTRGYQRIHKVQEVKSKVCLRIFHFSTRKTLDHPCPGLYLPVSIDIVRVLPFHR